MILALLLDTNPAFDLPPTSSDAPAAPRVAAPAGLTVAIAETVLAAGDTATALVGVTGYPAPTLTYQWTLDGADVDRQAGPVFAGVPAGVLRVRVTATNSEGVAGPVTSAPVTVSAAASTALLLSTDAPFLLSNDDPLILEAA